MWIVVWSYYNSGEKVRNNILYMALAFERESINNGLVQNGGCYVQFMNDFFFSQFFVDRKLALTHFRQKANTATAHRT